MHIRKNTLEKMHITKNKTKLEGTNIMKDYVRKEEQNEKKLENMCVIKNKLENMHHT